MAVGQRPASGSSSSSRSGDEVGDPLPERNSRVRDVSGQRIGGANLTIELTLEGSRPEARLRGARSALTTSGAVTFAGINVDRSGTFVLRATSGDLSALSNSFDVEYAFRDVEARFLSTCGTTTGGLILCWGANGGGLGLPSDAPQPLPLPASIAALDTFYVGTFSSCGLLGGGAYCQAGGRASRSGEGL